MNAKSIVEKAFAKARGEKPKKSGKKEPLPRKPEQIAASASPKNRPSFRKSKAASIKRGVLGPLPESVNDLALPDSLKVENRKPLTPEEQARVEAAAKAAPVSVADKQGELRKQQAEHKREKSRVRVEKLLAKKAGSTAVVPLQGKAALRAIAASVQEQITNGQIKPTLVPTGTTGAQPKVLQKGNTSSGRAGKPAGASKAKRARGTKAPKEKRASRSPSNGSKARYDWRGAAEAAKAGTLPKSPDFSANTHRYYRAALDEVVTLVKARDLKKLKAHKVHGTCSSPQAIKKYQKIAIAALEAE